MCSYFLCPHKYTLNLKFCDCWSTIVNSDFGIILENISLPVNISLFKIYHILVTFPKPIQGVIYIFKYFFIPVVHTWVLFCPINTYVSQVISKSTHKWKSMSRESPSMTFCLKDICVLDLSLSHDTSSQWDVYVCQVMSIHYIHTWQSFGPDTSSIHISITFECHMWPWPLSYRHRSCAQHIFEISGSIISLINDFQCDKR